MFPVASRPHTQTAAPRRQTLSWKNGYALTELSAGPAAGEAQGRFADRFTPATAESARAANASPAAPSLPDYVINDKKVGARRTRRTRRIRGRENAGQTSKPLLR